MFERTSDSSDFDSEEKQEARAFLRERFLKVLTSKLILNKSAEFYMFDNARVTAEYCGSDIDIQRFAVHNMKTSIGIVPDAVLRTNDIIRIKFPEVWPADSLVNSSDDST